MLESKLHPPRLRPDHVSRPRLLGLLDTCSARRLTVVCAPAGYGKSELLAVWTATLPPDWRVAWITVGEQENAPTSFCSYVLQALQRAATDYVDPDVASVVEPVDNLARTAVLRILNALWGLDGRIVLVIDNYHEITNSICHEALRYFLLRLPPTVHVVIGTRFDPPLGLGALRARGDLGEVRAADLQFTDEETTALLATVLPTGLAAADVARLKARTEGWGAGLYLAALSLRDHPDPSAFIATFTGQHRHLVDYFGAEVLERLSDADRTFLVQTAMLDQISGPLCDALLDTSDAAPRLRHLAQQNLFVFPLDERWQWYRCHPLFRDLLLAELQRRFSDRLADLYRRAAAWYAAAGDAQAALQYALAAGDERLIGDIFLAHALPLLQQGRLATVTTWLAELPEVAVAERPALALATAWTAALAGQPPAEVARRTTLAADGPDEGPFFLREPSLAAALALARASWLVDDVGAAIGDANAAAAACNDPETPAYLLARAALGQALYLAGRAAEAQVPLEAALRAPLATREVSGLSHALATLALVSLALGEAARAGELARRTVQLMEEHGLTAVPSLWISYAALGQVLVREGRPEEAEAVLGRGVEPQLERLQAWPLQHILALLSLVALHQARGLASEARDRLEEARAALRGCHDAGVLPGLVTEAERGLGRLPLRPSGLREALSEGELRILRLLATDLTQREIGQELYLSVNTVKSHTRAIYGKLDATSRAEAVARARALHLIA
jgi:LuxR family maltose regulon positive regulatory protein